MLRTLPFATISNLLYAELRKRLFSAIEKSVDPAPTIPKKATVQKKRRRKTTSAKKKAKRARKTVKAALAKKKVQVPNGPLDSLLLMWKAGKNKVIKTLSATALAKGLEKERQLFKDLEPVQCKPLVQKFKDTMRIVVKDELVLATLTHVNHGPTLRDAWVKLLTSHINKAMRVNEGFADVTPESFVAKFLAEEAKPKTERAVPGKTREKKKKVTDVDSHPPGDESDGSLPDLVGISDTESSSSSSSSGSESEEDEPDTRTKKKPKKLKVLVLDEKTKGHIARLRRVKDNVKEMEARDINFIADLFVNGSAHIKEAVEGRGKDPKDAAEQLSKGCAGIISLFDKVAIRQKTAASLSKQQREELLESESKEFSDLSIALHLIRIGKAGAKRVRSKVEDDLAKADFERVDYGGRMHKYFQREIGVSYVQHYLDDVVIMLDHCLPFRKPNDGRGETRRVIPLQSPLFRELQAPVLQQFWQAAWRPSREARAQIQQLWRSAARFSDLRRPLWQRRIQAPPQRWPPVQESSTAPHID